MNRDPFLRLALLALATAYAVGLLGVFWLLGPAATVFALAVGTALAACLTIEVVPDEQPKRPGLRAGVTRRFGGPPLDDETYDVD